LNRHQQVFQNHYQTMMGFVQNVQNVPGGFTQTPWVSPS
jgi:hypothetical protein